MARKSAVERRPRDSERIEGARPIIEAIRAGRRRVLEVALPDSDRTPGQRQLRALAEEHGIPIRPGSGVAVRVSARAEPYPEEAFESLLDSPPPRLLVALDRVTDVGNLGSIARSAETAGASGVVLEYRRAPPIGPGVLRASAGALEHLRLGRAPNLRRALALARDEGLAVLAAEQGGAPLEQVDSRLLRGDLIWVFGSEDRGLRQGLRELADEIVGIPLRGEVSSLGVASAAAYLLHRTAEIRSV